MTTEAPLGGSSALGAAFAVSVVAMMVYYRYSVIRSAMSVCYIITLVVTHCALLI